MLHCEEIVAKSTAIPNVKCLSEGLSILDLQVPAHLNEKLMFRAGIATGSGSGSGSGGPLVTFPAPAPITVVLLLQKAIWVDSKCLLSESLEDAVSRLVHVDIVQGDSVTPSRVVEDEFKGPAVTINSVVVLIDIDFQIDILLTCHDEEFRRKLEGHPPCVLRCDSDGLRNEEACFAQPDADVHAILSCLCGTAQFPELL